MKNIFYLILLLMTFSCSLKSNVQEASLIMPPNFSEVPDLNNPEVISNQEKQENVDKLKELLLKSD